MENNEKELVLTRQEILILAQYFNVQSIVGMKITQAELDKLENQKKELEESLQKRGLLKEGAIPSEKTRKLSTLFTPERALIVVRDIPNLGKQILIFLNKKGNCLLHSFPGEGKHRIVDMSPTNIENLLLEWFPVVPGVSEEGVLLKEDHLVELIQTAEQGDLGQTHALLSNIDTQISKSLISSLQSRKWSGSFALLEIEHDKAADADSFTAWSGEETTWSALKQSKTESLILFAGGDAFLGKLRHLIRKLAQFEKIVRAYKLSPEELAFAFTVMNQQELANEILRHANKQPSDSNWKQAGASLLARGLSYLSPQGFHLLTDDFEKAVAPFIVQNSVSKILTASSQGTSQGTLYILQRKSFCMHFARDDFHVLECGNIALLPTYIINLFQGFGDHEPKKQKPSSIRLDKLTKLLDMRPTQQEIEKELLAFNLQQDVAAALSIDLANHAYRVSITGLKTPKGNAQKEETRSRPTLLLLKGNQQDWMFAFSSGEAKAEGSIIPADRELLLYQFSQIIG